MCDKWDTNLIDLSIGEEELENFQRDLQQENNKTGPSRSAMVNSLIFPPKQQNVDNLENNPFDCAQQMADTAQDPFELLEKKACIMANSSILPHADVRMAQLISIEDDDKNINSTDTTMNIVGSTPFALELLDNESPPISMSRSTPDSDSTASESIESSGSNNGNSTKFRKSLEYRKRLLKFSLSNASFNSPLSHHTSHGSNSMSAIFNAAAHYHDHMIATDSPVKLVDDDHMGEEETKLAASMEKDFDADLEMLSIPMLKELSGKDKQSHTVHIEKDVESCTISNDISVNTVTDISVLREKLRNRRLEHSNNKDVIDLIQNLKTLICENNLVNGQKKEQANNLLEKLSCALHLKKDDVLNGDDLKNIDMDKLALPPQPIVRQGTFDIELQKSNNENGTELTSEAPVPEVKSQLLESEKPLSPAKDIPEIMFKSSATYDSEPIEERENLMLPTVDPISPISSHASISTNPSLNEIVEQLGKLLEQHQITQTHSDISSGMSASGVNVNDSSIINPTFIVVMPTAGINKEIGQNHCRDDLSISTNNDNFMRRRSQSLSIHDKVKIVQLPLHVPPPRSSSNSSSSSALPTIEAKTYLNINGHDDMNYTTPIRNTTRRYTLSSATPYKQSMNNAPNASFSKRLQSTGCTSRYSIDATREVHSNQAQTKAIAQSRANLNTFKPDLKRKVKSQGNTDSIMKSKAPLKAIIPVKKLAPMLASTLPVSKSATTSNLSLSYKAHVNTSMHLVANTSKMSYTSTPMPQSRANGASLDHMTGFPNACSTPALTPMRPCGTNKNNPHLLLTPTAKQQTPANTTEPKKRSLPELQKGQSPVKARSGLPTAGTALKCRVSLNPQSNTTKTVNNRSSTRLSSRYSTTGATTNKENKKP